MKVRKARRLGSEGAVCFWLGFLVPALLGLIGYIVIKVWPFGNGTVLIIDSLHQYLPFYTEYHDKLTGAGSLFYSFSAGFGYDFWATFAYYLASPLNLLIALVPRANVCDFMDYLILFKIAMCGGIFSWYLHRRAVLHGLYGSGEGSKSLRSENAGAGSGRRPAASGYDPVRILMPVAFAVMFTMGNFIIGYYFNLMWLDSIAMLPLIMYGIEQISSGRGGLIYGLSLFYGIWCNYYIGFMLCLFSCLYLLVSLLERKGISPGQVLRRCLRFGWYSLLAGGAAAMVLLPAYRALTSSESMTDNSFPSAVKFYTDFIGLMLSHGAEQHPINISDTQVGLNAYCGTAVLILVLVYVLDRKISWREKLGRILLAGLLLLSFAMNILNYVWHGFHTQNGLPNRFAFLYVCILLVMSFDTLSNLREWHVLQVLAASLIPIALFLAALLCGRGDTAEYSNWVYLTPALLAVWMIVFLVLTLVRPSRLIGCAVVGGLLLAEAGIHGIYGYIYNENVTRDIYLKDQASWQEMIGPITEPSFFRSEIDSQRMRNVSMFAGANSIVLFNSMMQESVTDFCDHLGIEARTNKNGYAGVTELMNNVFGIRYVLSSIGNASTMYRFPEIDNDGNLKVYFNENALSIGFLVNSEIRYWDPSDGMPIEVQNQFITLATGLPGIYNLDRTINAEDGERYEVKIPDGKQVYLYLPERVDSIDLNTPEYSRKFKTYTDHLYTVNAADGEDIADFTVTDDSINGKDVYVYLCRNDDVQEVTDLLARDMLENVRVFGNRLQGDITASKDGILLLTVPWSDNWQVRVDGEKYVPLKIGGMLTGLELKAGEHAISLKYVPGGFYAGVVLTLLCLVLMAVTAAAEKRHAPDESRKETGKETEQEMTIQFSKRSEQFGAGIFTILDKKKDELQSRGKTIYNLSIGTPDFPTPKQIMDAVAEAAAHPENYRYSLNDLPELKDAVASFYLRRFGVELSPDEIMSVYGSQEGMAHIALPLCDPGDVVLVPNPGYPIFRIGPELCGAKIWEYPLTPENGYLPDFEAIPEEIRRRAKLMVVSYPGNPLCKCAPDSFYEELIRFAKENSIVILHDSAYADIIFDGREGKSFLSWPGAKEVGIEFYSLSKTFDYTGARMSFVVGNAAVIERFRAVRSQIDYGIFLPVQYGAIAALSRPLEEAKQQSDIYEQRCHTLCDGLTSIGWEVPRSEGTMFVWAPLPKGYKDSDTFCLELMEKSGVICTPGSSFGSLGKQYVRFALVLPDEKLKEAVESIAKSGILN